MVYTIEQLQSMTNGELYAHWQFSRFPFDQHDCGGCLTMHNHGSVECALPIEHSIVREYVTAMGFEAKEFDAKIARENLEKIFALRKYFGEPAAQLKQAAA